MSNITTITPSQPGIPEALKRYHQFINWRLDDEGAKVPCNVNGQLINAHDQRGWLTFEEAARSEHLVAFVLTKNDPFVFLDFDKCIENGAINQNVAETLRYFGGGAYEVSQSGKGVHLIVSGAHALPAGHKTRLPGIEIYSHSRFIALTGMGAVGDAAHDASERLAQFVQHHGLHVVDTGAAEPLVVKEGPSEGYTGPADDVELITRMLASTGSVAAQFGDTCRIQDLWAGNAHALMMFYPPTAPRRDGRLYDASKADIALMNHLAYWTGKDAARMQRLFTASGLYRPDKYGGKGQYRLGLMTTKAIASCKVVYGWQAVVTGNGGFTVSKHKSLMKQSFPPRQWLIEGIMRSGSHQLSAAPKLGKSNLIAELAIAVASGGKFLGRQCTQGHVIYLPLEEDEQYVKERADAIVSTRFIEREAALPIEYWFPNDDYIPTIDGQVSIINMLAEAITSETRLVLIDTLSEITAQSTRGDTPMQIDAKVPMAIKKLHRRFPQVTFLTLHHTRKEDRKNPSINPFEKISGTQGIQAKFDCLYVMADCGDYISIDFKGRGLAPGELAVKWEANSYYRDLGDVEQLKLSTSENAVYELIKEATSVGESLALREIEYEVDFSRSTVKRALASMTDAGKIIKENRRYKTAYFGKDREPGVGGTGI